MNTSSAGTFESYRRLAIEQPNKARRYRRSIHDTLRRGVHPVEAARLREALQGIADGLSAHPPVCAQCGRELTDPDSIAKGVGAECERKMARAS